MTLQVPVWCGLTVIYNGINNTIHGGLYNREYSIMLYKFYVGGFTVVFVLITVLVWLAVEK